jgi:hypothetical protein
MRDAIGVSGYECLRRLAQYRFILSEMSWRSCAFLAFRPCRTVARPEAATQ